MNRMQGSGCRVRGYGMAAVFVLGSFNNFRGLWEAIKAFASLLGKVAMRCRPPRARNVLNNNNGVFLCTPFPHNLGGNGTRGNECFFIYKETTGGQLHEKYMFTPWLTSLDFYKPLNLEGCEACQ
jgi:hypothetical protein